MDPRVSRNLRRGGSLQSAGVSLRGLSPNMKVEKVADESPEERTDRGVAAATWRHIVCSMDKILGVQDSRSRLLTEDETSRPIFAAENVANPVLAMLIPYAGLRIGVVRILTKQTCVAMVTSGGGRQREPGTHRAPESSVDAEKSDGVGRRCRQCDLPRRDVGQGGCTTDPAPAHDAPGPSRREKQGGLAGKACMRITRHAF